MIRWTPTPDGLALDLDHVPTLAELDAARQWPDPGKSLDASDCDWHGVPVAYRGQAWQAARRIADGAAPIPADFLAAIERERATLEVPAGGSRRALAWSDDDGDEYDRDRAAWRTTRRIASARGRIARLIVPAVYRCSVDARQIASFAARVCALVDRMQGEGWRLSVTAADHSDIFGQAGKARMRYTIKHEQDPLDVEQTARCVAPWGARGLQFAILETLPANWFTSSYGACRPIETRPGETLLSLDFNVDDLAAQLHGQED